MKTLIKIAAVVALAVAIQPVLARARQMWSNGNAKVAEERRDAREQTTAAESFWSRILK